MCRHSANEHELPDELVGQFIDLSSHNISILPLSSIKESTIKMIYTTFDSSCARPIETPTF
jgi:hypothetical protein